MTHASEGQANRETSHAKMAIWWFLASEVMTFGGFLAAYLLYRMQAAGAWSALAAA